MLPFYDPVSAKRDWTHTHVDALQDEIAAFLESNPCKIIHDTKSEPGYQLWRIDGEPNEPPIEISLRIGDVLYNLRSFLDHLLWKLVVVSGGKPTRLTEFPICNKRSDFFSKATRNKLSGLPSALRTKIERLQPYKRANALTALSSLPLLDRLYKIDKHRHFHLIVVGVQAINMAGSYGSDVEASLDSVKRGAVLARVKGAMDVHFLAEFDIAFGETGIGETGDTVMNVIHRLDAAVSQVFAVLLDPLVLADEDLAAGYLASTEKG